MGLSVEYKCCWIGHKKDKRDRDTQGQRQTEKMRKIEEIVDSTKITLY